MYSRDAWRMYDALRSLDFLSFYELSFLTGKPPLAQWIIFACVTLYSSWLGLFEAFALINVLMLCIAASFFFASLRHLFKQKLLAYVGCLALMGAPFINRVLLKGPMQESPQMAIVCFALWLAVYISTIPPLRAFLYLVLLVSLAFLVKITTPVIIALPTCYILVSLYHRRAGWRLVLHGNWTLVASTLVSSVLCLLWYAVSVPHHLRFISISLFSPKWGEASSFFEKVSYWISVLFTGSFSFPVFLACIVIFSVQVILLLFRKREAPRVEPIVSLITLQICLSIVVYSLVTADTTRFMTPHLPMFILVVCGALQRCGRRVLSLLLVVFVLQFLITSSVTLGYDHRKHALKLLNWPNTLRGRVHLRSPVPRWRMKKRKKASAKLCSVVGAGEELVWQGNRFHLGAIKFWEIDNVGQQSVCKAGVRNLSQYCRQSNKFSVSTGYQELLDDSPPLVGIEERPKKRNQSGRAPSDERRGAIALFLEGLYLRFFGGSSMTVSDELIEQQIKVEQCVAGLINRVKDRKDFEVFVSIDHTTFYKVNR